MELKFNGRTYTESELNALESEAYRSVPIPSWLRAIYVLLILAIGGTLFLFILQAQIKDGNLLPYGLIPLAGLLATIFCARDAWLKRARRTYTVVLQPENQKLRVRHSLGSTLALIGCIAFLWIAQYMNNDFDEYWWAAWPLLPVWLFYFIYSLAFMETRPRTEAANVIAARDKIDVPLWGWQLSLLRFCAQWPVRYALGFVMYYACFRNFTTNGPNHFGWSGVVMLLIAAIMATYELALPLLGVCITVGLALILFGLASLLPVSVAIIIAALIIAQSLKRSRKD